MNKQFRIRLALLGIFTLLAAMVISETGFSQPPGFPGRPNIPQPPGMPNIPQPNFPGGPPQMPRPQIPSFEKEWRCSKCNHLIGTGIATPNVARCTNCGTRFDNTVEGIIEASRERMNPQVQNGPIFTKIEETSNTKNYILIGVLSLLLFLVIVGCIVGIIIRSNKKPARKRGSARKRPASRDDDNDERPRRRSARNDLFEDEDDEKPRSRRKEADDETPDRTKKSSIRKNRYYNEEND